MSDKELSRKDSSTTRQRRKRSRFSDAPTATDSVDESFTGQTPTSMDAHQPTTQETAEQRIARLQARIEARMKEAKVSFSQDNTAEDPSEKQRKQQLEEAAQRARMLAEKYAQTYGYNLQNNEDGWNGSLSFASKDNVANVSGESFRAFSLEKIPVKPVSTLKVNEETYKKNRLKRILKVDKSDFIETDPRKNPYYDPRVKAATTRLPKKNIEFLPEGFYQEKAERMREKAEADALRVEMRRQAALASEAGENVAAALLLTEQKIFEDVPDVEWWDIPFLSNETYEDVMKDPPDIRMERISHYIEHPLPIRTPRERKQAPVIPLMLTEKERKRLRHQQRVERAREEQMLIQMGLKAPPPPKVKLSNMMRVFGNEAVQDPTRVEAEVRSQMEQRRQEHEATNAARALTSEQKKEKRVKKIENDRDKYGLWVAVFRVISLEKPQHRFKVDRNAQELHLSGCCIIFRDCNVIVVEGSYKSVQKYKKLCLRRIRWNENEEEDKMGKEDSSFTAEEAPSLKRTNRCVIVWEGSALRPAFRGFRFATIPTEESVRSYFEKHRVEYYFDMAVTFPIYDTELVEQQTQQSLSM
eukprot:jgi/Galph1/2721/GphlegSOOS_G1377.1